eukprot:SAG31_NODE_636_length_13344_cov_8.492451_11_plen_158_part_00
MARAVALATLATAAAAAGAPYPELLPQGDSAFDNWTTICANKATCPTFKVGSHRGTRVLTAQGNGRVESFGWVEAPTVLPLEVGKTYCFTAELDFEGFEDLQRHTRVEIRGNGYVGGVFDYHRSAVGADGTDKPPPGWVTATKQFEFGAIYYIIYIL